MERIDCPRFEELLSDLLENALPADINQACLDHLGDCPACTALKEKMEALINQLAEMEEEVPFFLKNRLYHIAEQAEEQEERSLLDFFRGSLPKWAAAAAGTAILFFNLFYFTNIYPEANRRVHSLVAGVEKVIAETGGLIERLRDSRDMLFSGVFGKKAEGSGKNQEKNEVGYVQFLAANQKGGYNG